MHKNEPRPTCRSETAEALGCAGCQGTTRYVTLFSRVKLSSLVRSYVRMLSRVDGI
jgi:hypothetical protein